MGTDTSLVTYLATTFYDLLPIEQSIRPFCGYSDKNYSFVDANDKSKYVLKIVNEEDSSKELQGKLAYL